MKKILTVMLLVVTVLLSSGFNQQAVRAINPNFVEGTVTDGNSTVNGVVVRVQYGPASTTVVSDANGHFIAPINFAPPVGSELIITAKKDDYTGRITIPFKYGKIIVHVTIVKTTPIPEYGALSTVAAAGLGLGVFMYVRQRNASVVRMP
jgi:hypothetical protein